VTIFIGIFGSLIGVIVGAFLTRWVDAGYERRREVREAVASALTLQEELRDAENGIRVMIEDKKTTQAFLFPGLAGAWESHREALLVVGIPHADWRFLAHLFRQLLEVTTTLKADAGMEIWEENLRALKILCGECAEGRRRLDPFVIDVTTIPLIRPRQVFERKGQISA
jgi:hypothetical protein